MKILENMVSFLIYSCVLFSCKTKQLSNESLSFNLRSKDKAYLKREVSKMYAESECSSNKDENIFTIYSFDKGNLALKHLNNKDSVLSLESVGRRINMHYLIDNRTLLYDNQLNIIAVSDGLSLFCAKNYKDSTYNNESRLLIKAKELDIVDIIELSGIPIGIYFGFTKESEVFVFNLIAENMKTQTLTEYLQISK